MRWGVGIALSTITLVACGSLFPVSSGYVGEGPRCAPADTVQTTIPDLIRNPERFLGTCVAVTGIFDGDDIFATLDEAVKASQPPFEGKSEIAVGAFIDWKREEMDAFWSGDFTGRVETCRDAYGNLPRLDEPVVVERWIMGCQHNQSIHLIDLRYENLRRVNP